MVKISEGERGERGERGELSCGKVGHKERS